MAKNDIENRDHAEFAFRVELSRTCHAVDYVSGDYKKKITPQTYRASVRSFAIRTLTRESLIKLLLQSHIGGLCIKCEN